VPCYEPQHDDTNTKTTTKQHQQRMPPHATEPSATTSPNCPVITGGGVSQNTDEKPGLWNRWFSSSITNDSSPATAPPPHPSPSPSDDASTSSSCPVRVRGNNMIPLPASVEESANHSQIPAPGQRIPLSTQRVISSIPRGNVALDASASDNAPTINALSVPAHQPANAHNWQYPSEQQFYNAMLKKGYRPPVESIPSVLQIHNAVNERSWMQVCKWEKELHNNAEPKLVKFVGRPKDLSPKAWLNSRIFMTQEPFDRHDWYVEDVNGGEPRRYVIDFYEGKEKTGDIPSSSLTSSSPSSSSGGSSSMPRLKPPSMYIDVRPALDNPSAAVDRMTMFVREALPGLSSVWDSYKATSSSNPSSSSGSEK
jgi:hypothetical protein